MAENGKRFGILPEWRNVYYLVLGFNLVMVWLVVAGGAATALIAVWVVGDLALAGWLYASRDRDRDCPACGHLVPRGRRACDACGHSLRTGRGGSTLPPSEARGSQAPPQFGNQGQGG
ncbi:zinc ribbon domain-containing protein [Nocardioides donggukensis]|uniref:Zinc ribbon domain-containing protein n=1 Tax=Nocardioides donggukensis TaxID=2774019 RepID=A0A927K6R4_9ACTN|nr:zinc ribbon domain-containing protein [Nocardioides donggukensis]MBD8868856.1 zinc ribbon domain-containing protein [Nocardioides donggukensis]